MNQPTVIRRLDENLVNRIAAGEVVQRPVNALKELLENSLDAKSTNINICVQCNNMKFLQIQDNGTGIRKDDLEIVCERFTTSKLSKFEDLNSISTFGFRGEALASISHVAHLSIVTKTADAQCAYVAQYKDGKLIKPPKPTAGNQGTQITVEDLFYNVPARQQALKNANEEFLRILNMVGCYAIHNPSVGFTIKKHGASMSELRTNSKSTHIDNIKEIHGKVARELLEIEHNDEAFKFKLHGYISNVDYSSKKPTFILFINNRLVDSVGLRKAIESVYSVYLFKGSYPFIYISLNIDPRIVDVNVHPTKHEVLFLHEDSIIEKVKSVIDSKLVECGNARVFPMKKPAACVDLKSKQSDSKAADNPNHMVRTDSNAQKINKFFNPMVVVSDKVETLNPVFKIRPVKLTSVISLREEIEKDCHPDVKDIFSNFIFVGCIDRTRSLIQYKESLYLCNTEKMLEEMFYQMILFGFGGLGEMELKTPLPLIELINLVLESPLLIDKFNDTKERDKFAFKAVELLKCRGPMLFDYFSFKIDDDGRLESIPYLLNNYIPDLGGLPLYIYNLATEVNWNDEKECFRTFSRETAKFYSRISLTLGGGSDQWKWVTEHIVYHYAREIFRPSKDFGMTSINQMTSISELYKVFERC